MKKLSSGALVFLTLIFFGLALAWAEGALSAADYKYLDSIGWKQDNDSLKNTTDPQKAHLHDLINDSKISGKVKRDKVNGYLVEVSLSQDFDVLDKAKKGQ